MNSSLQPTNNPLDLLPPPILPNAIEAWPPAIGWWILALSLLLSMVAASYTFWMWRRANALKRAAVKTLILYHQQYIADQNKQQYLFNVNQLLRRFCLQQYPQLACAKLSGQAWLDFLKERAPALITEQQELNHLIRIYQPEKKQSTDINALHLCLTAWFKSAEINKSLAISKHHD